MGTDELKNLESLLRVFLADLPLVGGLSLLERQALEGSAQIVKSLLPAHERGSLNSEKGEERV
jgi:hypothetical protein